MKINSAAKTVHVLCNLAEVLRLRLVVRLEAYIHTKVLTDNVRFYYTGHYTDRTLIQCFCTFVNFTT